MNKNKPSYRSDQLGIHVRICLMLLQGLLLSSLLFYGGISFYKSVRKETIKLMYINYIKGKYQTIIKINDMLSLL